MTQADLRALFTRTLARDEVYFANHSLGRPLDQTADDVLEALEAWYGDMDLAWAQWMQERERFSSRVQEILGFKGTVIPKASCGQGLRAVLNALGTKPVVVASTGEFDSLDFILKAYLAQDRAEVRWVNPSGLEGPIQKYEHDAFLTAIQPGVDLVILSAVYYATGQVLEGLGELIEHAHRCGARVLVDSYHGAGVLPLDLAEADFVVGGCYKYLRGGPGACWLAIHERSAHLRTLDTGWYARENPLAFARVDHADYAEGGAGWDEATPAILPLYQARAGLQLAVDLGVHHIRSEMTPILGELRSRLPGAFQPQNPDQWGQYVLVPHPYSKEACQQLRVESKVVVDARLGCIRFGPDMLTTSEEIATAAEALARLQPAAPR